MSRRNSPIFGGLAKLQFFRSCLSDLVNSHWSLGLTGMKAAPNTVGPFAGGPMSPTKSDENELRFSLDAFMLIVGSTSCPCVTLMKNSALSSRNIDANIFFISSRGHKI